MKKLLIAAATVVAMALGIVSVASALHGGWDLNNETGSACASCHRAHTGAGPELLKEENAYLLCYSCHGDTTQKHGKDLNPWQGKNLTTGKPLNGGTIDPMNGSTSQHTVAGLFLKNDSTQNWDSDGKNVVATGVGTAYGGTTKGAGIQGTLECVSCHDPHGSTNYAHLRDSHSGNDDPLYTWTDRYAQFGDGTDKSLPFQDYQVVETTTGYKGTDPGSTTAGNVANYTVGMNAFCASCHKSYLTGQGSGHVKSDGSTAGTSLNAQGQVVDSTTGQVYYYYGGTQAVHDQIWQEDPTTGALSQVYRDTNSDGVAMYRHTTTINFATQVANTPGAQGADDLTYKPLRFAAANASDTTRTELVCTTCHFAHGTTSKLTGYPSGPATTYPGPAGDTALLYLDGRQVCFACHLKSKMSVASGGTVGH